MAAVHNCHLSSTNLVCCSSRQSTLKRIAANPLSVCGLCWAGSGSTDFAATLTDLLRDVALALDENEPFLRDTFGPGAVLAAAAALQRACDEEGTRVLHRFIQLRRLPQLVKEVSSLSAARRSADTSAAMASPVDPRQACLSTAREASAAFSNGP